MTGNEVLVVLPECDFDPTESAVPWQALTAAGYRVSFATPQGRPSAADARLVEHGFGPLSPILMTRRADLARYAEMVRDSSFRAPLAYEQVRAEDFAGLLVPGGHAPGMKTMLESRVLQSKVVVFFEMGKPVGAVCHGVLLLARSTAPTTGRSVLFGRRTTALTKTLELSGWSLTFPWLRNYYRTYPITVQEEVTAALANPKDFVSGPLLPRRDSEAHPERGFTVRDGAYLSARWPGDCHRFARDLVALLRERKSMCDDDE